MSSGMIKWQGLHWFRTDGVERLVPYPINGNGKLRIEIRQIFQ